MYVFDGRGMRKFTEASRCLMHSINFFTSAEKCVNNNFNEISFASYLVARLPST